jgi:hypothetical protein
MELLSNNKIRIRLLLTFLLCTFPVGHDFMPLPLLLLEPFLLVASLGFNNDKIMLLTILLGQAVIVCSLFLKEPHFKNILTLIGVLIFLGCITMMTIKLSETLIISLISCLPFLFFAGKFITSLFLNSRIADNIKIK